MTATVRVRSNSTQIYNQVGSKSTYATEYNTNGTVNFVHNYSTSTFGWPDFHLMVDRTYPRDFDNTWRSGRRPISPCFHVTARLSELGRLTDWTAANGHPIVHDNNGRVIPISGTSDGTGLMAKFIGPGGWNGTGFALRVPDATLSDLSEKAFNYFSDVFPDKLSFAEFVQGFTQLKSLLPSVGDSIGKTITGGYLNKTFGWDNLLSDLNTLSHGIDVVIERMNFFKRTYGIPTRLGFVRNDVWQPNPASHTHYSGTIVNLLRIKPVNFVVTYRATCWIYQVLTYVSDLAGFLRVMFGQLGLDNPVKAFWNTLPMSFVVDWFFNVSQRLDNLTRLNPVEGWNVTSVTNSQTYEWDWEVCHMKYNGGATPTQVISTHYVPMRVYERNAGLSFAWAQLNPNDLSPTQLSLLLAMLHQFG